jgi:hypothetical protein
VSLCGKFVVSRNRPSDIAASQKVEDRDIGNIRISKGAGAQELVSEESKKRGTASSSKRETNKDRNECKGNLQFL